MTGMLRKQFFKKATLQKKCIPQTSEFSTTANGFGVLILVVFVAKQVLLDSANQRRVSGIGDQSQTKSGAKFLSLMFRTNHQLVREVVQKC